MATKRTQIDFKDHDLIITNTDNCIIHHLKKPNTSMDNIKFINAGGILAVTGDYGNWIFCREFHPDQHGRVSDGYWHEKLSIASTQNGEEWDYEATEQRLKESLSEYLQEGGVAMDVIKYYQECIKKCEGTEDEYKYFAYEELPNNWDFESIIFCKKYKYWLLAIFDGFEEICNRLKTQNSSLINQH